MVYYHRLGRRGSSGLCYVVMTAKVVQEVGDALLWWWLLLLLSEEERVPSQEAAYEMAVVVPGASVYCLLGQRK